MRISVNLATRPFVELRPLFARLRIAMVALLLLAVGLGFGLRTLNARAKVATAQMDALKARTAALQQERSSNEARMRQPDNQAVLQRSQFLNDLFARKSFSWTAVMMELEHVVPYGIQVTSIEPVRSKEGEVSIRLRVTGDRDKAIQLVRNLETSQRFIHPRLAGETALSADKANAMGRAAPADVASGNGVEFEIMSGYNPLSPDTPKAEQKSDEKKDGASAKPVAPKPVAPKPALKPTPKPVPSLPAARPAPPKAGAK